MLRSATLLTLVICLQVTCIAHGEEIAAGKSSTEKATGLSSKPFYAGNKNVNLSDHEKQIAKELGYDEEVIILLKQYLHPEMMQVVVPITGQKKGSLSGLEFTDGSYIAPLLPEDREAYLSRERDYPELKSIVKEALDFHDRAKRSDPRSFAAGINNEVTSTGSRKNRTADAYLALMYYEPPHSLEDINRSTPADNLHTLGRQIDERRRQLDQRMAALRASLQELGYRINVATRRDSRTFKSREDAVKYLQECGTVIDGLRLSVTPAGSYESIYPVHEEDFNNLETKKILMRQDNPLFMDEKAIDQLAPIWNGRSIGSMLSNFMGTDQIYGFRIEPGSTVEKLGQRRWRINRPARYVANAEPCVASVIKVGKGSSGFNLVVKQGTNGANYNISTQMILSKLKQWNEKYGVNIIEAKSSSLKISFKKLPDDLSELCTEMFLFCPDLIDLQGGEQENAATMRHFAGVLQKTKVIDFWWD